MIRSGFSHSCCFVDDSMCVICMYNALDNFFRPYTIINLTVAAYRYNVDIIITLDGLRLYAMLMASIVKTSC